MLFWTQLSSRYSLRKLASVRLNCHNRTESLQNVRKWSRTLCVNWTQPIQIFIYQCDLQSDRKQKRGDIHINMGHNYLTDIKSKTNYLKTRLSTSYMNVLNKDKKAVDSYVDHTILGWSGGAKVSCILRHRSVQLILAYSRVKTVILVASKGIGVLGAGGWGGDVFISSIYSLSFLFLFLPCSLFHLIYHLFSPFLWETTQNDPQGLTCR